MSLRVPPSSYTAEKREFLFWLGYIMDGNAVVNLLWF